MVALITFKKMENLTDFLETHYTVSVWIANAETKTVDGELFKCPGECWEKAEEWTKEFIELHKNVDWGVTEQEGEVLYWLETLEDFLHNKIISQANDRGVCLFSNYELLPDHIEKIINSYNENKDPYKECRRLLKELKPHGYTFEYYLDGVPFNLKKEN